MKKVIRATTLIILAGLICLTAACSFESKEAKNDRLAVENAVALINKLPDDITVYSDITTDIARDIESALSAYNALSSGLKEQVANYDKLNSLQKLSKEKTDRTAAAKVADMINKLPSVADADRNTDVKTVTDAYGKLTETQKELIEEDLLAKLTAVENTVADWKKLYNLNAKINNYESDYVSGVIELASITSAENDYNALSEDLKEKFNATYPGALVKLAAYKNGYYTRVENEYNKNCAAIVAYIVEAKTTVSMDLMVFCNAAALTTAKARIAAADSKAVKSENIWTSAKFVLLKGETEAERQDRIKAYANLKEELEEAKALVEANKKVIVLAEKIFNVYDKINKLPEVSLDYAFTSSYDAANAAKSALTEEEIDLLVAEAHIAFTEKTEKYKHLLALKASADNIEVILLSLAHNKVTVASETKVSEMQDAFDNPPKADGKGIYSDPDDVAFIQSLISANAKTNLQKVVEALAKAKKLADDTLKATPVVNKIRDAYNLYVSYTRTTDKQREFVFVYSTVESYVNNAKDDYDELTQDQKALVDNYSYIATIEREIATAKITATVRLKLEALNSISVITLSDEAQINAAKLAYENDIKIAAQRTLIAIEYQYYVTANARITELKKIDAAIKELRNLVDQFFPATPNDYIKATHGDHIVSAVAKLKALTDRNEPDMLTQIGATYVDKVFEYSALKNAKDNATQLLSLLETDIDILSKTTASLANILNLTTNIQKVKANIDAYLLYGISPIPGGTAAITDIVSIAKYDDAVSQLAALKVLEAEYLAFLNVDFKTLPTLAGVSISDEALVASVAATYDALTAAQKAEIGKITNAASTLSTLKNKIISLKKIDEIITLALPYSVSLVIISDKSDIEAIVAKYHQLTDIEKSSVSTTYSKLLSLLSRITVLERELADWKIMQAYIDNVNTKLSVGTVVLDNNNRDLVVEEYNALYTSSILSLYTSYKKQWTAAGATADQSKMLQDIENAKKLVDDCITQVAVLKQLKLDKAAAKVVIDEIKKIVLANISYLSDVNLTAEESKIAIAFNKYNAMTGGQLDQFMIEIPAQPGYYIDLLISYDAKAKEERAKYYVKRITDAWAARVNRLIITDINSLSESKIIEIKALRNDYETEINSQEYKDNPTKSWIEYIAPTTMTTFLSAEIMIQVKACNDEIVAIHKEADAIKRLETIELNDMLDRIANITSAAGSYTLLPAGYAQHVLDFKFLAVAKTIVEAKIVMVQAVNDVENKIDSLRSVLGTVDIDHIANRNIIISTYNAYVALISDVDALNYAKYLKAGYNTYIIKAYTDLTTKENAIVTDIVNKIANLPLLQNVKLTDKAAITAVYVNYMDLIAALQLKVTNKQKLIDVYSALLSLETNTLSDFEKRIDDAPDALEYRTGSNYLEYETAVVKLIAEYKLLTADIKNSLGTARADKITDLETLAVPYGKLKRVADMYLNLLVNNDGTTSEYFGKVDINNNQSAHRIRLISANAAYAQFSASQLSQFSIEFASVVTLRNDYIVRNAKIDEIQNLAVKISNLPGNDDLVLELHASMVETYITATFNLTEEEKSNDLTITLYNKILSASGRITTLQNEAKTLKDSIDLVVIAELLYNEQNINMVANLKSKYNALTEGQKSLVTNYSLIFQFEAALNEQLTLITDVLVAMNKLKFENGVSMVSVDPALGYISLLNKATALLEDLSNYKPLEGIAGLSKAQNLINRVKMEDKYYNNYVKGKDKIDKSLANINKFDTTYYILLDPFNKGNSWYCYANATTYLTVLDEYNKLSVEERKVAQNVKISAAYTALINIQVNSVVNLMLEVKALPSTIQNLTARNLFVNVKNIYDSFFESGLSTDPEVNSRQKAINGNETYTKAEYKSSFDLAMSLLTNYDAALVQTAQSAIDYLKTISIFTISHAVDVSDARKYYDGLPASCRIEISAADYQVIVDAEREMSKLQSAENVKQNIMMYYAKIATLKGSDSAVINVLHTDYNNLDASIRNALVDTTQTPNKTIFEEITELKTKADHLSLVDNIYYELVRINNLRLNSKFTLSEKAAYQIVRGKYNTLSNDDKDYIDATFKSTTVAVIISAMDGYISSLVDVETFVANLTAEYNKLSIGIQAITLADENTIIQLKTDYNNLNPSVKYTIGDKISYLTALETRIDYLHRIKDCNDMIMALINKYNTNQITSSNLDQINTEISEIDKKYNSIDSSLLSLVNSYGTIKTIKEYVAKLNTLSTLKLLLTELQVYLDSGALMNHKEIDYNFYSTKVELAKARYASITDTTLLLDVKQAYEVVAKVEARLAATKNVSNVFNRCSVIQQKLDGNKSTIDLSDEAYVLETQNMLLELGIYGVEVLNASAITNALNAIQSIKNAKAAEVKNRTQVLYEKHNGIGLDSNDKTEYDAILKVYNSELTDEMRTLCAIAYDQLMICQSVFTYFVARDNAVAKVNTLYNELKANSLAFKSIQKQAEVTNAAAAFSAVYNNPAVKDIYKPSSQVQEQLSQCMADVAVWESVAAFHAEVDKIGTVFYDSLLPNGKDKSVQIANCKSMLANLGALYSPRVDATYKNKLTQAESDLKVAIFEDAVLRTGASLSDLNTMYNALTAVEKGKVSAAAKTAYQSLGGAV